MSRFNLYRFGNIVINVHVRSICEYKEDVHIIEKKLSESTKTEYDITPKFKRREVV